MSKIYEYNGKHYCDEDISLMDADYGGDILDLYTLLMDDGALCEETILPFIQGDTEEMEENNG